VSADSDPTVRLRLLVPQSIRRLPVDLTAVVGFALLTSGVVLTPPLRRSVLASVAVAFVLCAPGYAVVAALFPRAGGDEEGDAIDWVERLALSVGVSVAALAFVGLAFAIAPWEIRVVPVVLTLAVIAVGVAGVGAYRQWSLPPAERVGASLERWAERTSAGLFASDGRSRLLNALLVVCLLVATASVVYAVAVPRGGAAFTEFYVVSETETGDLVAADYPATFDANQTNAVHVGLTNHEHREMEYVVVVAAQRVPGENDSLEVRDQRELTRVRASVEPNETWTRKLNVTPEVERTPDGQDERLRLVLYLYRDDAPSDPSAETAYRELRLVENGTTAENGTEELN
jgi:uncharacterized membrane protein